MLPVAIRLSSSLVSVFLTVRLNFDEGPILERVPHVFPILMEVYIVRQLLLVYLFHTGLDLRRSSFIASRGKGELLLTSCAMKGARRKSMDIL